MGKGRGKGRGLTDVASSVDNVFAAWFGSWAGIVAKTPAPFIPGCIVCAVLLGPVMVATFGTLEIRPSKLFCPPESVVIAQEDWIQENYNIAQRVQSFIVTASVEGSDMLLKTNLLKVQAVYDGLAAMQTQAVAPSYPEGQAARAWNFESLCLNVGGGCGVVSVLNLFDRNATSIAALSQAQILSAINSPPPHVPPMDEMLGGIARNAEGEIISATAVATVMLLEYRADPDVAESGIMVAPFTDAPSEAWEDAMIALLEGWSDSSIKVSYSTQGSQAMEYVASALSDLGKLGFGYLLVFGYTALAFGSAFPCVPCNPNAAAVSSRAIMTVACIATLNMSLATTMGLGSLFGYFISPLNGALPFILLGVAVDDAFVIVTAFNEQCGWHLPLDDEAGRKAAMDRPVNDRLGEALKHAGVSITVTSLTNFFAFAVGHTSLLPALSSFCAFAAIGVMAIYFYMLTFFCACLILDDMRQAVNRRDCCPCIVAADATESSDDTGIPVVAVRGGRMRAFFGEMFTLHTWGFFFCCFFLRLKIHLTEIHLRF
eukprot:COSAG05_NODE_1292_length_5262_cov_2.550068_2_plen_544_part_00